MKKNTPNILIVDDVPANIKVLGETLINDYEISVTTNGFEALEIAASENTPDLILLDIMMPEMDGYEVCRRLKADERTKNIPVIFITARTEEAEETKGFELGAVDYITKPFSPAIVKVRVSTHLDLKRHRDNLEELNTLLKQEIAERKRSEEALKYLLKKQEINTDLAKRILSMVNGSLPRYIPLSGCRELFVDAFSIPCYAEGGDHYFVRTVINGRKEKTTISLKDQSGHEVGCVLRSIITDLLHNSIINNRKIGTIEKVITRLNSEICQAKMLNPDDFFTAITAEIDHETLVMRYISAGHPPFILIRGDQVICLPEFENTGANLPLAIKEDTIYSAGEYQLKTGDKIIFYTDGLTEMPLKNLDKMIIIDDLKKCVRNIVCQHKDISVLEIMCELLNNISMMSREKVLPGRFGEESINTSGDDVTMICVEIEDSNDCYEEIWKPKDSNHLSELIAEFYERLKAEWNKRGYESEEVCVRLVLEESVVNAWTHGNEESSEKKIIIRWRFGNDFHLEVIDEGKGFDWKKVPDPTDKENITHTSGRGIFIIQHFADDVRWENSGRHLITSFKKYPDSASEDRIWNAGKMMNLWIHETE